MTGRELIKALLDGDANEDFDLDDDVYYRAGRDPMANLVVSEVMVLRHQRRATSPAHTQIVLGCEKEF